MTLILPSVEYNNLVYLSYSVAFLYLYPTYLITLSVFLSSLFLALLIVLVLLSLGTGLGTSNKKAAYPAALFVVFCLGVVIIIFFYI